MDSTNLQHVQQVLAIRIKALRKEIGVSREELPDQAEIDRSCVSQLERKLVNPSLSILVRVSKALGVHVSKLLKE